jgi:hypothetical protein
VGRQPEPLAAEPGRLRLCRLADGPDRRARKFANWIAPPALGINRQPVDFEYVRFG